ncbi:tol-pal system protein YbgF [Anatilimnocola aggregata]|uniref:Tol-pal system protein YbgF n=1 Tax=Anatilimnocola aggregata TaxID=2528021 RepID=A0A517YM52_9BACT|nr:tetratricopeptide repeat protein [Anatilimnocola aggregata]QDU31291.1 tol-pal system protein YbgF [Anatilimnocola aggregata]
MRRHLASAVIAAFAWTLPIASTWAQAPAAPMPPVANQEAANDEVSKQASALEAELGKYKDNSPEAAEAMFKLVELYHREGRLFGLVRVGQQFVSAHAGDARHQAVMLKLLDGLEALSRNKEMGAACRQFVARYPTSPEVANVEVRLANALSQLEDRKATAEASRAVWQRQGGSEVGRSHGVRAVQLFSGLNAEGITASAVLAEEMLDKLPPGEFARQLGVHSFHEYRRLGQWAKASVVGNKLLQKNLAGDNEGKRQIHLWLAENHGNLGQHANAAESFRQARSLRDDQFSHFQLVYRMFHAGAKPDQLQPLVDQYVQKFPQRPDRFQLQSYLAASSIAAGDKPRGVAILATLLPVEPAFNGNASLFVRENGNEPAQLADSEQKLKAALGQAAKDPAYLRYVLAFDLYRDRLKDVAKAKQTARELISQSPTDDGHTAGPIEWLLSNAADENEFKSDLALIMQARQQYPQLGNIREWVRNWIQAVRQNKDLKERAAFATEEQKKTDAIPLVALWIEQRSANSNQVEALRNNLLKPEYFSKVNDRAARAALQLQADYYRHNAAANKRGEQVRVYAQFAQKFPTDQQVAYYWLETATDYGKPEDAKAAAQNWLKFQPQSSNGDIWRRIMIAADKNNDPEMAKQAFAWIQNCEKQHGHDPQYSSGIGDILLKHKMEAEAVAWWTFYSTYNRQHSEARECALRLLGRLKEPAQRAPLLADLVNADTDFFGRFALMQAADALATNDLASFEKILKSTRARQAERPLRGADLDMWTVNGWVDGIRQNAMMAEPDKARVLTAIRDLQVQPAAAGATLALLDSQPAAAGQKIQRLLELQKLTRIVGNDWWDFDRITPFVQSAVGRKDFLSAATLATGMLANIPNVDEPRKKAVRDLATQSLARMGAVGLTIDDSSPLAPLLQAALYFRLGDERLAFDAYLANKALFDANRNQLPPDLLMFVCDRLIAGGGDANHDKVEEILRGWLIAFSESMQVEDTVKARMQLLLARNFYKAQRFDIARSEFTTVVNRYAKTPQAIEGEFGIGETYLSQKVYDQAEAVFEKLARSTEIDVVVRAEFLRGVLAFRRGDRDEARDIFRAVLERVPNVELANQALYNLAEVYGAEERYIDQLNLLRTVGRLGRASKRRHVPGMALSIVVHDSDLGISRGHNRIPVRVTTEPGGDSEMVYLTGSGAGKGLFRVDLETRLGQATKDDRVLQLTGNDTIKCDYPEEFKSEFKNVPLSDVEIRVASDAKFEMASNPIVDKQTESFSEALAREAAEEDGDQRRSQVRPATQIKPGNPVYLRVKDGDRDLTNDADEIVVKLAADSGDQVQVKLKETGPHTGIFEASATTGELPAGALATDTAIDHSPLMAIDRDPKTTWMSQPDGGTPKSLTIDMKDLKKTARVRVGVADPTKHAPVRADLYGSQDGEFWFRIASQPEKATLPSAGEAGRMKQKVYNGEFTNYTTWDQIAALWKNSKAIEEADAETLRWVRPVEQEDSTKRYAVMWHGKLVQPRSGAVRIQVLGNRTALAVNGREELPIGGSGRSSDLWLNAGVHDVTIFAASATGQTPVEALIARSDLDSSKITLIPFRASDFDLESPVAKKALAEAAAALPNEGNIPLLLETVKLTKKTEKFGVTKETSNVDHIGFWQSPEDIAAWEVEIPAAGIYEVWTQHAHAGPGGSYKIEVDGHSATVQVPDTGAWTTYRAERVARVQFTKAGKQTVTLKPVEIKGDGLVDIKALALRPAKGASLITVGNDWEFHFPEQGLRYVRFTCNEYLGEALEVGNIEIAAADPAVVHIPTKEDVLALAGNNSLEIAAGDNVVGTYTDEQTLNENGGSQLLTSKLQATYFNASIHAIAYDFERQNNGNVANIRKELKRIDPGERIVVEVTDYDQDSSNQRDQVKLQVIVNDGEPLELVAVETEENTGIFTKEVDTVAPGADPKAAAGKLAVKMGDRVYIRYLDTHNTFPGHSVPREAVVYVTEPSLAKIRVLETRVVPPPKGSTAPLGTVVLPPKEGKEVSGVAFEAPLTVEVIDPDAAKDSRSSVVVKLVTSDGATAEVLCLISNQLSNVPTTVDGEWALEEGRFVGQVILQLGGKNSAAEVALTTAMPRNLIGKVKLSEEATEETAGANLVTHVLNLTGKDLVTASYTDARRPDRPAQTLSAQGRLISNGVLVCTDRDYEKELEHLHVGEKLFLKVVDPDLDASDARDVAEVVITTELGEKETVRLEETLAHSGVFTGSLQLKAVDTPKVDNLDPADPVIETYFGDKVTVRYKDLAASTESGELELQIEVPVVVGTDGLVAAFSKTFNDETLAVETKFRVAESYFELFKSHKTLGRDDEKKLDLESGRRILREVMEDYPDPKYAPRVAYLLGQFAQELGQWDEAIRSYDMILRQFPDHTLAPDAQYKLAQTYEEAGDFDQALEAYVTLAATHPKSPLIPNVMIRISDYFYKTEKFDISAQVGEKFLERFNAHQHAPRMAFRVGQCYYKSKKYLVAGKSFDAFAKLFPDDALCADSLFWAGESFRMGGSNREAFIRYNNCRWKHQESEAAKYARGRLALPEMLNQFEAEANSVDE